MSCKNYVRWIHFIWIRIWNNIHITTDNSIRKSCASLEFRLSHRLSLNLEEEQTAFRGRANDVRWRKQHSDLKWPENWILSANTEMIQMANSLKIKRKAVIKWMDSHTFLKYIDKTSHKEDIVLQPTQLPTSMIGKQRILFTRIHIRVRIFIRIRIHLINSIVVINQFSSKVQKNSNDKWRI